MTALLQDLGLAVRVLLGTKPWTLVVLLSLAVGIGANTALFTAVNGLLLQTVNVYEPERLVRFNHAGPNDMVRNSNDYGYSGRSGTRIVRSTFSFPMIEQLRAANTTLTGLAAGVPMGSLNVFVDGDAQLATGYQATGNYFTVIGVPAVRGRVFGEADDRPSAPPVAVISHAYWSKRFAGAPSAIGRVVSIKGQMVTIVGVTPADFAGIERLGADGPDVTVPLAFDALFAPPVRVEIPRMQQPTYWWLQLVGRLKPGVLAVLLACIGLFGLMSYNVARRTSEIGVRLALGAQRRTLIGMVMSESIRLVAIGIVLGLAAVLWAGRFVQTVVYGLSPSDPLTIGGAVALIAGVTALAGGVPARRASKVNPIEALRQQ